MEWYVAFSSFLLLCPPPPSILSLKLFTPHLPNLTCTHPTHTTCADARIQEQLPTLNRDPMTRLPRICLETVREQSSHVECPEGLAGDRLMLSLCADRRSLHPGLSKFWILQISLNSYLISGIDRGGATTLQRIA
jgi:hypothetical protein